MSSLLKPNYFTLEEYYALEKHSDRRWEYWDGEIVCMSGETKGARTLGEPNTYPDPQPICAKRLRGIH